MVIVGLDIGRNNAVAAALDHFPDNPKAYFAHHRPEIKRIEPNHAGLCYLKSLQPCGLVMEPTGRHYAAIWQLWAESINIPVYWVGHADLAHQRGSYGFVNKRDDEDAFCLALTYFDERFIDRMGRRRFLNPVSKIAPVHEKFLQLEQLDKNKNVLINQIRQRLCKEYPEASERRIEVSEKLGYSPFWGWLAGRYSYARVTNDYAQSVAHDLGIPISSYTREHAAAIVILEERMSLLQQELLTQIQEPEFLAYLKVFRRFGFGPRNQILLLTRLYPFEKFLVDGKPWIEHEMTLPKKGKHRHEGAKLQKRNRSLRSFQAALGLSYKLAQSGDRASKKFSGSDTLRSHLYMWAVDYIRRVPKDVDTSHLILGRDAHGQHIHACTAVEEFNACCVFRLSSPIGHVLNSKVIELEYDGVKGADKVLRTVFRATALLFSELCHEIKPTTLLG